MVKFDFSVFMDPKIKDKQTAQESGGDKVAERSSAALCYGTLRSVASTAPPSRVFDEYDPIGEFFPKSLLGRHELVRFGYFLSGYSFEACPNDARSVPEATSLR
jgi:hypothetical protein